MKQLLEQQSSGNGSGKEIKEKEILLRNNKSFSVEIKKLAEENKRLVEINKKI